MRLPILMLATVAACGGNDDGALLTIRAPGGPPSAARLEIVLASADASTIVDVDGQRTMPSMLVVEQARYYRQRATAGTIDEIAKVDGFVVRIEPNADISPDEQYIPFLLVYDDSGLVGVGSVLDSTGAPTSVAIQSGQLAQYFVDMDPLTATTGNAGIATGESMTVDCHGANQQAFRSGIAWRPASGFQLRLLLPDTSVDASAIDATARGLDLDCDGHEALDEDCDDLRAAFNNDGVEQCDGQDTNCDGARFEVVGCTLGDGVCGVGATQGVALCADVGAGQQSQCVGDPKCQCGMGNPGPCTKCILTFQPTNNPTRQAPCAPAVGQLSLAGCSPTTPCTVDVLRRDNPWQGLVSLQPDTGFAPKVGNVTDGIFLRAKLESSDVVGMAASSVGEIFLAVTVGTTTRIVGVDLELTANGPTAICQATNGTTPMSCSGP